MSVIAVTVGATMSRVAIEESNTAGGPSIATLSLTVFRPSLSLTSPLVVQLFTVTVYAKPEPATTGVVEQPALLTNVMSPAARPKTARLKTRSKVWVFALNRLALGANIVTLGFVVVFTTSESAPS